MKRFLFVGLLLANLGLTAHAQTDDIYATGAEQRGDTSRHSGNYTQNDGSNNSNAYGSNNGNNGDAYQSYNNPDDYVDYDDDSYSSRLNRFDNSFYNMGYYSTFYNPFWYNPYWVDPYWGWNPWRPHFGVAFGAGPFWTSYWGYDAWYGYPAWGCWGYGGFGWGGGDGYGGYWNRYYNTVDYHHGGGYYGSSYGPRSGASYAAYHSAGNGFRVSHSNELGLRSSAMTYSGRNNVAVRGNNAGNGFRSNNANTQGGRGGAQMQQSRGGGLGRIFGRRQCWWRRP